ncbi:MAG: DoxX family protein [Dermatophilus congolensis]|nr:DoxX family protein [Dermatophilus congolensis]
MNLPGGHDVADRAGSDGTTQHSTSGRVGRPWHRDERVTRWIGLIARLVLGGVLFVAGALKVGAPLASARAVQAYDIFPFDVAAVIGYALPVIEIAIGALLILGLFTRVSAVLGTLIMAAFVAGIASAWARGLSIDCGCFGGGGSISPDETQYGFDIARDIGFMVCGAWLIWRPRTALSLDARLGR